MYKSKLFLMLALLTPVCAEGADLNIQPGQDPIDSDSLSSNNKAQATQDQSQLDQLHAQEKHDLQQQHSSELDTAKNPAEEKDLTKQHDVEKASLNLKHAKEAHELHQHHKKTKTAP